MDFKIRNSGKRGFFVDAVRRVEVGRDMIV
jgi:hypothetical protein